MKAQTVLDAAAKQMQQDSPFIRLIEFTVPTEPKTVVRLANYDRDVSFDNTSTGAPIVWKRFPVALGEFRETRNGDLPQVTVNVCNVTRELMSYIDLYGGLQGEECIIRTVWASALNDSAAQIVFAGEIIGCEVDVNVAVFSLGQPSLAQQVCPSRRFLTTCVVPQYGGSDCGYIIPPGATNVVGGGFDFCPRHLTACRLRGDDEVARGLVRMHPRLMDGCPGVQVGNP